MTDTPADLVRVRLGQRLLHEMALRNWTQSDLAREATKHLPKGTLSRDNVHNYVHGKALPGPGFLLALAKALGTTADDLLPERGVNAPHGSSALPSTDVRDAGEGMAFLRVNRRVSWASALRVLEILNTETKARLAEEGHGPHVDQ